MKILRLSAENIQRLSVVEITPDGRPVIVIGGKNGAGKSSVLDAIAMALGGADEFSDKPVRTGERSAKVVVDLGDIVVTRTFQQAGGTTSLTVESKEGARFRSPQGMLDKLVGRLSFDPLEFERMDDKLQRETLRNLVGLDTADIDKRIAVAYNHRTDVNRTVKQLDGQLEGTHRYLGAPAEEVSLAALASELSQAEELKRAHAAAQHTRQSRMDEQARALQAVVDAEKAIATLEQQLATAKEHLHDRRSAVLVSEERLEAAQQEEADRAMLLVDTAPLQAKIASAEAANRQVRANVVYRELENAIAEERKTAEGLTAKIDGLEREKVDLLSTVSFPVPGLGFSDDGITFKGEPFSQASQAERLRVSVAMGLALNPKLRVLLVREGSALDSDSLRLLGELAAAADAQVWLERVAESHDGVTVLIEDGHVKAAPADAEATQHGGLF